VLFPYLGIPIAISSGQKKWQRVGKIVGYMLLLIALPLALIALIRLFIIFPVLVNTDHFSDLKPGSWVLVNKRVVGKSGDLIVYKENQQYFIGKIKEKNSLILIESSSGEKQISSFDIRGKIIPGDYFIHQ
jgi:signal peptidase I